MYRTDFWTLWEKARVGCFERTALKHVYYLWWNRSPAQAGCMRQVLRPGALGRPRGIGWRGRWDGGSGSGIHVKPWLILVNVWKKPLQYCKVISLQLIQITGKNKKIKKKKKQNLKQQRHTQGIGDSEIKVQIDAKLVYLQDNSKLHSIGHDWFSRIILQHHELSIT